MVNVIYNGIDVGTLSGRATTAPACVAALGIARRSVRRRHGRSAGSGEGSCNADSSGGATARRARNVVLLVVGDGAELARLRIVRKRSWRRIVGSLSRPSRRCTRSARGVRRLCEQLDQRRHLVDDSRGDGRGLADRGDARRRDAGDRRCVVRAAGRRREIPNRCRHRADGARRRPRAAARARPRSSRPRRTAIHARSDGASSIATPTARWRPDMCGISGMFALDGPLDPEMRAWRCPRSTARWRIAARMATASSTTPRVALRPSAAGDHRSRRAATSRWPTKTGRAGSSSTAKSTTTGRCGRSSKRKGIASAPSPTPKSSCTRTRSSGRPASNGSKACSRLRSTTAAGRNCSPRAIASGKKPFFYTVLDGTLHFASELPALTPCRCLAGRRRSVGARGLSLARLFPRAGDDLSRRLQAAARPLASRVANGRIETRQYLGRRRSSTPIIGPTRS